MRSYTDYAAMERRAQEATEQAKLTRTADAAQAEEIRPAIEAHPKRNLILALMGEMTRERARASTINKVSTALEIELGRPVRIGAARLVLGG